MQAEKASTAGKERTSKAKNAQIAKTVSKGRTEMLVHGS